MTRLGEFWLDPRLRLRQLHERIQSSLWVVPAIAAVVAITLAYVAVAFDRAFPELSVVLYNGGPESAREVLSTIASSMLTFKALVFSITILVLQLASNQFSPRVIRTFLREPSTKAALGIFIGTFVYAVVVLSHVRSTEPSFTPTIATLAALALVLVSVGTFIHYLHRMSQAVRAITVLTKIAAETRDIIEEVLVASDQPRDAPHAAPPLPDGPPDRVLCRSDPPGVLTFVDEARLVELAHDSDVVLELVPRVGDFVPRGAPLLRIWGRAELDDSSCLGAIAFDRERTAPQDPAFGFRQLVDVAVRALSPGINDPSTAVQALDQLHDLVRRLAGTEFPSPARRDGDEVVRFVLHQLSFREYVQLAFEEIGTYGAEAPQVPRRLVAALEDCLGVARPEHRAPLEEQLVRAHARARAIR